MQRRPVPQPLGEYERAHADPTQAIVAAFQSGGYSMRAIAAHFGVHYSTVSRMVHAAQRAPCKT